MITLTREEAQQVLNALDHQAKIFPVRKAIDVLRARLSHTEPEPVAWADKHDIAREGHDFYVNRQQPAKDGIPLYTAPQQREWTNDEFIAEAVKRGHYTVEEKNT